MARKYKNPESFTVCGIEFDSWHHPIGPPANYTGGLAGVDMQIGASERCGYWYRHPLVKDGVRLGKPHTPEQIAQKAIKSYFRELEKIHKAFKKVLSVEDKTMPNDELKPIDVVLRLLFSSGFIDDRKTRPDTVTYITTASYPFAGAVTTYGNRTRLRRGDLKVTVGKRTVNFYEVRNCKPVNFHQFKTSDITGIEAFLSTETKL